MAATDATDDFLLHVFPGSSLEVEVFRREIEHLNQYCQRFKGSMNCVLLTGEPGVGKTFTARAISAHSQWLTLTQDEKRGLYYGVNGNICFPPAQLIDQLLSKDHLPERRGIAKRVPRLATVLGPQLADDLAASELFGHIKGAFTSAGEMHLGIFGDEAVDDVLLDEIADLPLRVQAKLLQFIDNHTFRPVGGMAEHEKTSAHRLFLATNRPLVEWVQRGLFREDLYWRVQGFWLKIPPLRARKEIIRDLARSILTSVNRQQRGEEQFRPASDLELVEDEYCLLPANHRAESRRQISNWVIVLREDDLKWCEQYEWPGNVRELKQRLELYVYYNGHRRLCDVMPAQSQGELRGVTDREGTAVDEQGIVDDLVFTYLRRVLDGRENAPGQPNEVLRRFDQLVKRSVYKFKTSERLGRRELQQLFPDAKDADSTIGRWKS